MIALTPLGENGYLARFAAETEAASWAVAVRERQWAGVVDVVPAYLSVAVFADPARVDPELLGRRLRTVASGEADRPTGKLVRLPVLYDGEDLDAVARSLHLSPDEVIAYHCGQDYEVFAIGFIPGFPYAGYLPEPLCGMPRRESPRIRVPAGSVAIAGRQTGVYPGAFPGGWHLLGRTPLRILDLEQGYFPIRSGDRLRFEPVPAAEFDARRGEGL